MEIQKEINKLVNLSRQTGLYPESDGLSIECDKQKKIVISLLQQHTTLDSKVDDEKDLRDIIATQSESIELADKMLRESQGNEKRLRDELKYIVEHSYQYDDVRDIIAELKQLLKND